MEEKTGKINKMEIISVSMDRNTLDELNKTQEKLGFKSRSKLVRAGMDSLVNEFKALDLLRGHNDIVFTVVYRHKDKDRFGDVMEKFDDVITTEIHQHRNGNCVRILVTSGNAKRLMELFKMIKSKKEIISVNTAIL